MLYNHWCTVDSPLPGTFTKSLLCGPGHVLVSGMQIHIDPSYRECKWPVVTELSPHSGWYTEGETSAGHHGNLGRVGSKTTIMWCKVTRANTYSTLCTLHCSNNFKCLTHLSPTFIIPLWNRYIYYPHYTSGENFSPRWYRQGMLKVGFELLTPFISKGHWWEWVGITHDWACEWSAWQD